jgi:hypothetical protein
LENVPSGTYKRIAFTVGLNEKVNYGDPSQWPADHPLNPLVNALHWSWQGGYVFFALEGHYDGDAGFSLHLAKPPNQTPVTIEGPIDLRQDGRDRCGAGCARITEWDSVCRGCFRHALA